MDSRPGTTPVGDRCHPSADVRTRLLELLAHPNIASKRWIVRQYDHEVRGNTVVKPLVGPGGVGPGDASVIQPVAGSKQGLAIGCGMAVHLGDPVNGGDPYEMALAAVDECVRNLVCVGADPDRIAILDNFCWPSCSKPENLASLVRAAEGCYDAAKAYRTPFVSGKDSLNNQLRLADGTVIEIPPTLLITGMGVVADVSKCVTMDLKPVADSRIAQIRIHYEDEHKLDVRAGMARFIHQLIREGLVLAAHDASEGGPIVALAEMLIAGAANNATSVGLWLDTGEIPSDELFDEQASHYLVQIREKDESRVSDLAREFEFEPMFSPYLASFEATGALRIESDWINSPNRIDIPVSELRQAFLGTLDW